MIRITRIAFQDELEKARLQQISRTSARTQCNTPYHRHRQDPGVQYPPRAAEICTLVEQQATCDHLEDSFHEEEGRHDGVENEQHLQLQAGIIWVLHGKLQ